MKDTIITKVFENGIIEQEIKLAEQSRIEVRAIDIMNIKENQVKKALTMLGWTPPADSKPKTKESEEFWLIWFELDQKWIVLFPSSFVIDESFGAAGYAFHAALEHLGRAEAEFSAESDGGNSLYYVKDDEFWVFGTIS